MVEKGSKKELSITSTKHHKVHMNLEIWRGKPEFKYIFFHLLVYMTFEKFLNLMKNQSHICNKKIPICKSFHIGFLGGFKSCVLNCHHIIHNINSLINVCYNYSSKIFQEYKSHSLIFIRWNHWAPKIILWEAVF